MIAKIDRLLRERGYQLLAVKPQEVGVYYIIDNDVAKVVLCLNLHDIFSVTAEQLQAMQQNMRELFLHPQGRIPGCEHEMIIYDVPMLTILLSSNTEDAKSLCAKVPRVWLMDQQTHRLVIYENQPGTFYGLEQGLAGLWDEPGSMGNVAGSRRMVRGRMPSIMNLIIILVNIVVFLILSLGGDTNDAVYVADHGGMYPPYVIRYGEWWRLFTSMFLHFGITHLANNMFLLFFTGDRLERAVGKVRYLIIYLGSGLCGGILSFVAMMNTGNLAVSAGASGAIFGVIGALLWIVIRNRGRLEGLTTRGLVMMAALSLYFGFTSTGVDNWCHVGGLIGGFLLSLLLYSRKD